LGISRVDPKILWSARIIDARISGCLLFETVIVMQAAEDRPRGTTRNEAVTTTKKSVASTDRAWFRTNVLHACVPWFGRGGREGMYPGISILAVPVSTVIH
jgi:hypothetical protein